MCLFVFLVASFTFYLADSDDRELTTPTGSEDNVISFVYLDPSETQFSGTEPEDELGTLTVSSITPDGFDLSWKLKAHSLYDSFAVKYKDTQRLWDVSEVQLPGDATGSRIKGLKASTEYEIKLYGVTSSQRSALLEAVAVTGIKFSFRMNIHSRLQWKSVLHRGQNSNQSLTTICMPAFHSLRFSSNEFFSLLCNPWHEGINTVPADRA